MSAIYEGPVCYQDGWHWTVVPHHDGVGNGEPGHVYEIPGEQLVLEDRHVLASTGEPHEGAVKHINGDPHTLAGDPLAVEVRYRIATDADLKSWHGRKHDQFVPIVLEDGHPGVTVSADELAAIEQLLGKLRGRA